MTKRIEHPNGIDVFEVADDASPQECRAIIANFDAEWNGRQAEISQYQALRDEMLRIQKTYSEEIAAVRHEAALARHEAAKAKADADEADRLRHEAEERGFPQRDLT